MHFPSSRSRRRFHSSLQEHMKIYYKNKHSRVIQVDFQKKSCTYPPPPVQNKQQKHIKKNNGRILNQPPGPTPSPWTQPKPSKSKSPLLGAGAELVVQHGLWYDGCPGHCSTTRAGEEGAGCTFYLNFFFPKFAALNFLAFPKRKGYLDLPDMNNFCLLVGFLAEKAQILHTWKIQV